MRYPDFDGTQECAGVDTNVFFPDPGVAKREGVHTLDYKQARTICAPCRFQYECAMWAIHHDPGNGMFGGLTPQEREVFRKRAGIERELITIGDYVKKASSDEA
jgi:hypothetical protein